MLITQEQIFKKLVEIEKKVEGILTNANEYEVKEISLSRACKLLRLGHITVTRLVRSGKLQARTYRDKNRQMRFRFLLKDIKAFQEGSKYQKMIVDDNVETAEEIANRIFNKPERKAM